MKVLIISNRVLSEEDNNGKTLYSFVKNLPKGNVSQLYFYGNLPVVSGYNYFQLSDRDVILGKFNKKSRGRKVSASDDSADIHNEDFTIERKYKIKKTDLALVIREAIWKNSWSSPQMDKWLDKIHPNVIFFLGGDSIFAYKICEYVKNRCKCDLYTFLTDDYVLKRSQENFFVKYRRKKIYEALEYCIKDSTKFFTISERMRITYKRLFGKDSEILVNLSESFFNKEVTEKSKQNEYLIFVYAGSIYYGRDRALIKLAKALHSYNSKSSSSTRLARLHVYSNWQPDKKFLDELKNTGAGIFKGSLSQNDLKNKLNASNVLVFVESFDDKEVEKIRLSFSTKIPEYLSLEKPIVAIGPKNTGSMDFLNDTALCIYSDDEIESSIFDLLNSEEKREYFSKKSATKYKYLCDKYFNINIFGEGGEIIERDTG